jgi:threonine efflux protein
MFTTLATIWVLHIVAMVSPGANFLLVSQLAASNNTRNALRAAAGVAVGAAIWSASAVLGMHAVFSAFPSVRLGLQLMGGVYLLWLASRLWRAGTPDLGDAGAAMSGWTAFRRGFLTNITNPKSALFFGSVFAASFPANPSHTLQVAAVAMIVCNALTWHTLLAYLFSRPRVRQAYARHKDRANRVAGVLLCGMGASLLAVSLRAAFERVRGSANANQFKGMGTDEFMAFLRG